MRHLVLLTLSLFLMAPNPIQKPGEPRGRWALLIGVDDYNSAGVGDLDFAANDARAIAHQLIASGTYLADHVTVMTPDAAEPHLRPTRSNILEQLGRLGYLEGAETVFFLFSGHGAGIVADGEPQLNVLFPQDAVPTMLADTTIPLERVIETLNAIDASRRFVVMDACRNEMAKSAGMRAWGDARYQESEGTYIMYGTRFGGYSYEDPSAELGALTRYLEEGLEGAADGLMIADGVVSADELFRYAYERLQVHGQTGQIQVPYRDGEWTGVDFPLVISQRSPPPPVHRSLYPTVEVPRGTSWMGSLEEERGRSEDEARREVEIPALHIGQYEVTQALWVRLMGENPSATRRYASAGVERDCGVYQEPVTGDETSLIDPDYPVVCVDWCESLTFANRLSEEEGYTAVYSGLEGCADSTASVRWDPEADGYRLLTEAEWERAARAGSDEAPSALCDIANVADEGTGEREAWAWIDAAPCDDGASGLAAVGEAAPNSWDLYDTIGNVWEWTWDRYRQTYRSPPRHQDPGARRSVRGAAWNSAPADARVANREWALQTSYDPTVGLRLARSAP